MASICPTCSCTEIDVVDVSGEAVCVSCGTILEENNIVSSIEFQESGGGAHSVVGQFVSATASKAYGNIGTSGRNYGIESRANTLANGKKKIRQIAGMLRLGDHYVDSAFRLFALALQRNFTHGRKTQTVIAACLYIVCRRERSPHLLIDFSDKLQINVYVLGGVFLKFCKLLQIHLPLIDPSLYIHRFASQLNFAGKTHSIATTALRLVATMKRDWIETGRRPSGICGAALLIAARSQSVMCSLHDVMDVVNIGERTLKQRLYEFSLTPTAQLTYDQVGKLEMSRVECDPPSFQRHREKEVMEMLLLESEKLPLEQNGRKRLTRGKGDSDDESDEDDESDGALAKGMLKKKAQRMKDEEMSRFLSGDAFYKKKQAEALLGSNGAIVGTKGGAVAENRDDGEDEDEEIDYGFDNANDQIVNRASRLAAQEVLLRVRKKSARYIMRKREEANFYKTIERDLTMALEDDASSKVNRGGEKEQMDDDANGETEHSTSPTTSADDEADASITRRRRSRSLVDSSNGIEKRRRSRSTNETYEQEEDAEDPEDEDKVAEKEDNTGKKPSDEETVDTFSDLDDDEINSLLLTREEAEKKKLLWEKMNKDFIQEQEQKRLLGLSAPDAPKKKRRKKTPDVNAPPPDTAQHAIYKLKSRRINYEVIDELFGEAASNGF
ncbi:Transcription factor IIIB subunit [Phytophthora citrophthora]|uniref:B-related factor 1 n=1 Tax=Phytophthora citrophthora TaxID=4793 RepID=A0AAD9FYK8_9STRA|nr:Transcription factor IIIB subunit [Phytophthora citrophthora]